MTRSSRAGLAALALLLLGTTACGADHPAGTISKDQLPGSVKVARTTYDDQAGQPTCPAVNDAEDAHVMVPSVNYDQGSRAAVAYELEGPHHQVIANSVWRLSQPRAALAQVAAGLRTCVKDAPEAYRPFEVKGHPDAVAYLAMDGDPEPIWTRRILVPLSDRVVIVSAIRQGGTGFAVPPEDLLSTAIAASKDAPKG